MQSFISSSVKNGGGVSERFNNEIDLAFKEIVELVDQSQLQVNGSLEKKQSELIQLATRHRCTAGFKNDTLGIWYDAKAHVAQALTKLKTFIQERSVSISAQAGRNSQEQQQSTQRQSYEQLLTQFETDLAQLKRGSDEYQRSV